MARPVKSINLELVEKYASQGLTEAEIAQALNISESTWYRAKKRNYDRFSHAIKKGRAKGVIEISNALFEKAKAGNTTAMIFWLKCKAGWRENAEPEKEADKSRENLNNVLEEMGF